MKKRNLLLIIVFILLSTSVVFAEESIATEKFVYSLLGKEGGREEKITISKLADILVDEIEITYDNYLYYRSHMKDTANVNIIKLYSEGILRGDGNGYLKPDRELTEKEVVDVIGRLESPIIPERPVYKERKNIPILMYHEINTLPKNGSSGLYVSQENFAKQLDALRANGYNTVTMEEVYQHWTNKTPLPEKPIVLSFDDGYASHYDYASVELSKRGMTGTFYIITGDNYLGGWYIEKEKLKEMHKKGMEIGSHTVTHIDARYNNNETILKQYKESKEFLEELIGDKVEHFCYPYGGVSQYAKKALQDLGYKTAVRTTYGKANASQGMYDLKRVRIDYHDSINGFLKKIK